MWVTPVSIGDVSSLTAAPLSSLTPAGVPLASLLTPDPRPTVSQQAPGDLVKPARLLVPDGRASPLPGLPRRATFCLLSAYLYAKEDD